MKYLLAWPVSMISISVDAFVPFYTNINNQYDPNCSMTRIDIIMSRFIFRRLTLVRLQLWSGVEQEVEEFAVECV